MRAASTNFARELWLRIETIHAVTYFGDETPVAGRALGLDGFWSTYFAFRAAPLGPVGSGVVEATFCNFAPAFVARWVPSTWTIATPEAAIDARSTAAAATLLRLLGEREAVVAADAVTPTLAAAMAGPSAAGRALFGGNRDLQLPSDPVARLWQLCTTAREHRGDGHVAALTAAGLDGIEAHVLRAAEQGADPADLQRTRGWTPDDWSAAVSRLRSRGLLGAEGAITQRGRSLRSEVEQRTDELAAAPFAALSDSGRDELLVMLSPLARTIATSGVIRYPNPMGLPSAG